MLCSGRQSRRPLTNHEAIRRWSIILAENEKSDALLLPRLCGAGIIKFAPPRPFAAVPEG
jgi:hypothetical protein